MSNSGHYTGPQAGPQKSSPDGAPDKAQGVSSGQAPRLESVKPVRLDNLRVLLVDDSPDNQRLFQRILTGAGALVDVAENGAIAVSQQASAEYDAIVMDIRMPILDGYQATRLIREQGYTGPVIALTAHANPGEEDRCRQAGCSQFYLKPIDRMGLLNAVANAVGTRNVSEV